MIAIRKFNTLGLKNSTDFVLGFIGDDGGALTVALTSFYRRNRNTSPTGKLRL
ncbi:hypothetical protein X766_17865 [Mesorhizobium sp. LSJC255A00]|nr:hypothetical protein X766_17865 [Mesorhizobium sp. LSJC255A00]ESZ05743.1 hypothetical protein X736_17840 [Mesorhizobium sp. L2C089B000]